MKTKVNAKGASDGGESANIKKETEKNIIDGDSEKKDTDINVSDTLRAEIEDLNKVKAGQDRKISELLSMQEELKKEKEEKDLAGKSTKEQNEVYQKKITELERKESFRKAFKDSELDADEWAFINSDDYNGKAEKIITIFNREKEEYAKKKLVDWKLSELEKVNKNSPLIKDNQPENKEDPHLDLAKKLKNNN